ncbi:glycine--tRNA ligase subunit beta [Castellaniella sp.]|uniref:glycine--tRNA ligase subunit beta n=1 Tax=Castellaniella sp. TaxID=1955812 RepID=UPI002AFEE4CA|nr:glycine--tRNA ligase subunit beta [Castellaniella sp.]
MNTQALLVELLTEELPPKALQALGEAFANGIQQTLEKQHLLADGCSLTVYATPRRLAVHLSAVLDQAPDQSYAEKLMPAAIGLDAEGNAAPALLKKLQAKGLSHLQPADLARHHDGKQDVLYAEGTAPGAQLSDGLQQALDYAVTHLPIPKVMQYQLADGHTNVKFVRPAHALLALWGDTVVPVQALGLQAGRITRGHRFLCTDPISIDSADDWATQLSSGGYVVPSFDERRSRIAQQLADTAASLNTTIGHTPETLALLDEVTALVEWPTVYVGAFDAAFLAVPPECLILTMQLNQKYFPLFDPTNNRLTHQFLIVSNMQPADPALIIQGNERVVRPRLADAQFFYQTDLKTPLTDRVADLANSVYHNKLGTQLQRTERVRKTARWLAPLVGGDALLAARSAMLAHADLGTLMVGEFPELQGIMGAYYAHHEGQPPVVVRALRDQYRIRLDEPVTPDTLTATVLFMAERAETLIGIWGIGLAPTGERDPYGLRRAALGLISAYEQLTVGGWLQDSQDSPANLAELLAQAATNFPAGVLDKDTIPAVQDFIYERYRHQLAAHHERAAIDAVLALRPPLHQVNARVRACMEFIRLPEAESLAAANKRVSNLLKKADQTLPDFDLALLAEPAERQLAQTITTLTPKAQAALQAGNYTDSLAILAQARTAVDTFFTEVMVMAEDPAIRTNRLALLQALHQLMNQVADLSRLAQ